MRGQVVAWAGRGPVARIRLAMSGGTTEVPLRGAFRWEVRGPALCIGKPVEGGWAACPDQAKRTVHAQCARCTMLEEPECVFEPRCRDGTPCGCDAFAGVPHLVYIAFYGILPKVGMTQGRRVEARLREQGADAWLPVAGHPEDPSGPLTRGAARGLEQQISSRTGLWRIPERRRSREILAQLRRPVPWPAVAERAERMGRRLGAAFPAAGSLHRVEGHALDGPLPARPALVAADGVHAGRWCGAKGRFLFYEAGRRLPGLPRPVHAVAAAELIGKTVVVR